MDEKCGGETAATGARSSGRRKDDIGIDGTSEKLSNIIVAHAALGTDGASPGDLFTNNFIMCFQFGTGFQTGGSVETRSRQQCCNVVVDSVSLSLSFG